MFRVIYQEAQEHLAQTMQKTGSNIVSACNFIHYMFLINCSFSQIEEEILIIIFFINFTLKAAQECVSILLQIILINFLEIKLIFEIDCFELLTFGFGVN